MHDQHCGYWCPGATAPGHQHPQCWLNVHCICISFIQKYYTYSEQNEKLWLLFKKDPFINCIGSMATFSGDLWPNCVWRSVLQRKSCWGEKMIITQSDLHSENPYFSMTAWLYWNSPMRLNPTENIKRDLGPLLLTWFNFPAWISNHTSCKLWDEITYPFLNFNSATVEV